MLIAFHRDSREFLQALSQPTNGLLTFFRGDTVTVAVQIRHDGLNGSQDIHSVSGKVATTCTISLVDFNSIDAPTVLAETALVVDTPNKEWSGVLDTSTAAVDALLDALSESDLPARVTLEVEVIDGSSRRTFQTQAQIYPDSVGYSSSG
jgi:hypothetical protein